MGFLKIFDKRKRKKEERLERIKKEKETEPKKSALAKFKVPKKAAKKAEKRAEEKPVVLKPKEEAPLTAAKPRKKGDEVKVAPRILRAPQITEKATELQDESCYVFKVGPSATKPEIKKAIEEIYGVNVVKVMVINVPKKRKRLGRTQGWRQGYKKAVVKIKKGQTIEILPR